MRPPNPYPTLSLLKIELSPSDYQALIHRYTAKWGGFRLAMTGNDFWESLPDYQIAVCPYCGKGYIERLNTYGLHGWLGGPGFKDCVYDISGKHQRRCQHFVAVDSVINLNGYVPSEISSFTTRMDVPCITPQFLFDDPPTVAVMHSLPICRIEQEKFVPRYLLYTLTYYSQDALSAMRKRGSLPDQFSGDPIHPATFMSEVWTDVRDHPEVLNLEDWARQGKLLWLDPNSLALMAWHKGKTKFPYQNIDGYKWPFEFFKGKIRFRHGSPPAKFT